MIQPFALRGVLTTVGNDADGAPRAVVHCARDAIASQPSLPMYQPVVIVEAKWLDVEAPLGTATTKQRFGLVRPEIIVNGERYYLDIRFRMLNARELAAAQGFRSDYHFTGTKTEQIKQIGNAVPRRLARALCAAVLSQNSNVSTLSLAA